MPPSKRKIEVDDWKKNLFIWRGVTEKSIVHKSTSTDSHASHEYQLCFEGNWIPGSETTEIVDSAFAAHPHNKFKLHTIPRTFSDVHTIKQLESDHAGSLIKAMNGLTFEVLSSYDLDNGDGQENFLDDSHTIYVDDHEIEHGHVARVCGFGSNEFGSFISFGYIELSEIAVNEGSGTAHHGSRKEIVLVRRYVDDKDSRASVEGAEQVLTEFKDRVKSKDAREKKDAWRQALPYKL